MLKMIIATKGYKIIAGTPVQNLDNKIHYL